MASTYDVVCGMQVDPADSASAEHEGKTYYFCCEGCQGAFQRSPEFHLENWAQDHPNTDPTPA